MDTLAPQYGRQPPGCFGNNAMKWGASRRANSSWTFAIPEYCEFAVLARRPRKQIVRSMSNTPVDGVITGFGSFHVKRFGEVAARNEVVANDRCVFAVRRLRSIAKWPIASRLHIRIRARRSHC